jgi:DNA mismatch repair protein MutS
MRAIGVNLILAQMGGFVAAKTFKYYPYDSIISRITGDDNLFKNQSMFTVEMTELRTILKRSTTNTLVLGDEICHGTEHYSGLAIVAASIKKLSKIGASFVFATHMHDLSEVEEINELPNITKKHLYVEIDEDKFAYHRKLKDGPGPDTYGIEVARSLDMGSEFIRDALSIRNRLMSKNEKILETKKSKYNKNVFMDSCMICGSNTDLETHHIKEQCTAVNNRIDHFHKNNKHNLAVLCKRCHDRVTYENLVITGYIQTTDGLQLQFSEGDKSCLSDELEI